MTVDELQVLITANTTALQKEIAKTKEVKVEKKESSPIIFGFHKDGEVTKKECR